MGHGDIPTQRPNRKRMSVTVRLFLENPLSATPKGLGTTGYRCSVSLVFA